MDKVNKENPQHKSNEPKQVKPNQRVKNYAQYSGMAVQLGVTIAIGAFIGQQLDEWFGLEKPLMTALFSLLATVGGIYLLIRGLVQK